MRTGEFSYYCTCMNDFYMIVCVCMPSATLSLSASGIKKTKLNLKLVITKKFIFFRR